MGKGRAACCDKKNVKRGGWSTSEDLLLTSYIQKHGHTNWRALPTLAGLMRCGKSCRLRWINYLRPDVKRGNFTPQEELTIINLHNSFGNKWSKIASYLPGRTDNEIKNVWNTHLKKRLNNPNFVDKEYYGDSASPSYTSNSITSEDQNVQNALDVVQEPGIHDPNPNEKPEFLQIDSSHPIQDHKENPTSDSLTSSRPSDSPATNRAADDGRIEIPVDSEIDDIWELFDSMENEDPNLQDGCNIEWFRLLEDEFGLASDHVDQITPHDEIDYFPTWPPSPLNL